MTIARIENKEIGYTDRELIERILGDQITDQLEIKPLGGAQNLIRAAEALKRVNPDNFFIIDRDYVCDDEVEKSWLEFESGESNILLWRRKEIENYFLDTELLSKLDYCKKTSKESIDQLIKSHVKKWKFITIGNYVLQEHNERIRSKACAKNMSLPVDQSIKKADALASRIAGEWQDVALDELMKELTSKEKIMCLVEQYSNEIFESAKKDKIGEDQWRKAVKGKEIVVEILGEKHFGFPQKSKNQNIKSIMFEVIDNIKKEKLAHDFNQLSDIMEKRLANL